MRLLLIEDDPLIGKATQRFLASEGYAVDWVVNGADALLSVRTHQYGTILLDLGLPDMDGQEVLAKIRRTGVSTPVLVLTAREAVSDRIYNLDSGADDFIIKPFDLHEVCARIRVAVRRAQGRAEERLQVGDVFLVPSRRIAVVHEKDIPLTSKEYMILNTLMSSSGQVFNRGQLEEALYGWGEEIDSNSIEVHIHNLRKKLGKKIIETVHGVGYRTGTGCSV